LIRIPLKEKREKKKSRRNPVTKPSKRTGNPKQGRYRNSGGGRKFLGII